MTAYIKKQRYLKTNSLIKHLKLPVRQELAKPKISGWKEIIQMRIKINEIKTKNLYKESMIQKDDPLKKKGW
jgi:hypothetical protein